MEKLDTYTIDVIINKYLDLKSTVSLINGHKGLREKIFTDHYLINSIVKKLFLEKRINNNVYGRKENVRISQIMNYDTRANATLYDSLIKFRRVKWEYIFYDDSYIGFVLQLYNIPKYNINSRPCACVDDDGDNNNCADGFDVNRYWINNIRNCRSSRRLEKRIRYEYESKLDRLMRDKEGLTENDERCRMINIIEDSVCDGKGETDDKEYYVQYDMYNINDERFSIKLDKRKAEGRFVVSDLIFAYISKYDKRANSYSEKNNETIEVFWPEWCKNIELSNPIVFGNNKLYFTDETNNNNIVFSLVHERIVPFRKTIREVEEEEEELMNTGRVYDCSERNYSYYLDLNKDIYLTFKTVQECGENYSYIPCQPLEEMGFLYFKSDDDEKIDVLLNFFVDFDSHRTYISRKKIVFKCKKLIGSLGCLDFNYSNEYFPYDRCEYT